MNSIKSLLNQVSKPKMLIIFIVLFAVLYFLINGNIIGAAKLDKMTDNAGILDMQFGYDADEAYTLLDNLGNEGREYYTKWISPMDFIFPLTYMMMLFSLMSLVLCRLSLENSNLKYIVLLPVLTALMDYIENLMIIRLINNYPKMLETTAAIANIATIIKFSLLAIVIIIIAIGLLAMLVRRQKQKVYN